MNFFLNVSVNVERKDQSNKAGLGIGKDGRAGVPAVVRGTKKNARKWQEVKASQMSKIGEKFEPVLQEPTWKENKEGACPCWKENFVVP